MYTSEAIMKGDCNDSQEDPFQQKNSKARFAENSNASNHANSSSKSSEA